jgi:hypothetical protein
MGSTTITSTVTGPIAGTTTSVYTSILSTSTATSLADRCHNRKDGDLYEYNEYDHCVHNHN